MSEGQSLNFSGKKGNFLKNLFSGHSGRDGQGKDSELFMNDLFNLSGKKALITGSNKGIGRSMALGLAEAGADIIGVSASMPSDGGAIGQEVRALGRSFSAYQADLTNR